MLKLHKHLLFKVGLAFLFILSLYVKTNAQKAGKNLDIDGRVYEDNSKLSGATVQVLKNGAEIKTLVTPSNGSFKFSLDAGYDYVLRVSKAG